ncbi:ABC transporter substrate-binding protein [Thiospirochaeta perfilievii]|uniref:ABC transporter substrate-binding protein n=1 Tax=Thiospirochaeta perfilievii TaxID=252967 RepID=A0A5C1QE69_9SPIO|nr:ABC transporter substrate-binding protein [Thiospirochaeta perfilievii]QEN05881.1 ABC transporter substrate-binding protein [Thiospirochaeta perfilievii]
MKKILLTILVILVSLSSNLWAKGQKDYSNEPALVLGSDAFNEKFSPFYAESGYDMEINKLIQADLIGFDRNAQPDNTGLAYYQDPKEIIGADGKVEKTIYTFKLKDGITFSDGTPVTIDDVMFSYMVLADPNYTGPSTLYSVNIIGINEYRFDDMDYTDTVAGIKSAADNYEPTEKEVADMAAELTELYAAYGVKVEDFLPEGPYYEDDTLSEIRSRKYKADEAAYITGNLSDGIDVLSIPGIVAKDDKTIEITIVGVDPAAIYKIGAINVASKAYYGNGFVKGSLEGIEALNGAPMGAGEYRYVSFENNVVSLVANDLYYKGVPKIKKIKYQVTSTSNKLEAVKLGDFDISDPTASPEMIKSIEESDNIHYELIDNLGYGYIGINATNVSDKNVRKGLMHLMDRKPAIQAYYGNLASVIERPMSRVSWAYPKDSTEFYGYNTEKALEYFKEAGYSVVDGILQKDGVQLSVEIGIPADGSGSHPAYAIVLGLKNAGEAMGMAVNLTDYADGNKFWDDLDAEKLDIWCAAWGATPDPDMYQIYHSKGPSNKYKINDPELDKLIIASKATANIEERKKMYSKALDIIMDWAVEMPTYQRKNMYIFNTDNVNVDSIPKDLTPFFGYIDEIEVMELK